VESGPRSGIVEFVRAGLVRSLAWTASEPNGEALWTRVRETTADLLCSYWVDGQLVGSTVGEAFFVRCGPETMTQQDIDAGRLIVEVGIAPIEPAVFVVMTVEHMVASRPERARLPGWVTRIRPAK
jgi:Bacteriophage tail sheath protein